MLHDGFCCRSKTANVGIMLCQAVFSNGGNEKLAPAIVANKAVLQAMAQDPPSQMAQLIALEHYLTVTSPEHLTQVCASNLCGLISS